MAGFFSYAGAEEDVVVDAERDEEDEDVEGELGLDAGVTEPVAPQQVGQAEGGGEAEALGQLEEAKLIEVAEYRRLPGGKVERVYAPASIEPSNGVPSPADVALLLSAALETTRADVNAAALAQEAGEDRQVGLGRTVVRLNQRHLDELKATLRQLFADAEQHPDDDGVWTTIVWVAVDRQDRRTIPAHPPRTRKTKDDQPTDEQQQWK